MNNRWKCYAKSSVVNGKLLFWSMYILISCMPAFLHIHTNCKINTDKCYEQPHKEMFSRFREIGLFVRLHFTAPYTRSEFDHCCCCCCCWCVHMMNWRWQLCCSIAQEDELRKPWKLHQLDSQRVVTSLTVFSALIPMPRGVLCSVHQVRKTIAPVRGYSTSELMNCPLNSNWSASYTKQSETPATFLYILFLQ